MNIIKVAIKFLQGSAVTQNVQDGLFMHSLVANFLYYMPTKNYEYRLTCVKVIISKRKVGTFLRHSVYSPTLLELAVQPAVTVN